MDHVLTCWSFQHQGKNDLLIIVKSCFKCFRHFSSSCGDYLIHWFDYIHQFHNLQQFQSLQDGPSCYNSIQLMGSNHRLYMIEVVERLALVLLLLSSWLDNTLLRNQRGAHMVQELRPEVQVLWMTKGPALHHHHHHLWLQGLLYYNLRHCQSLYLLDVTIDALSSP